MYLLKDPPRWLFPEEYLEGFPPKGLYTFSEVSGIRHLVLESWFGYPLVGFYWWLCPRTFCKGLHPIRLIFFWYSGFLLFSMSFTFSGLPERRRVSLGYQCRFSLGGIQVIVISVKIVRDFPPLSQGFCLFFLSFLCFSLSFTFSEVSGIRILGLASWFRSHLAELSWWIFLQKNCEGSPLWG